MIICYNCISELCDYSLDLSDEIYRQHGVSRKNPNHLDISKLKDGDTIFVKTDFIVNGSFSRDFLPKIKTKFILVTGISDYSIDINNNFKSILYNPNLIHWFASNPPSEDFDKLSFIPIGFQEYERLGDNLIFLKENLNDHNEWEKKKNKIYIPYHSLTSPDRQSIIQKLSKLSFVEVEKTKLSFQDYINKIKQYKYVLSLRGNGWDCHRNYEIIFSGSVPVMQQGPISKNFKKYDIPYILIKDVSDKIFDEKYNIDKNILLLDYWKKIINDVKK